MVRRRADPFDSVAAIGCALPDVELTTTYGKPALKVGGTMFVCIASHKSAEPDSLVVMMDIADRDLLVAEDPDSYYLKEHYVGYPCVLVRLRHVRADALRGLVIGAHRYVSQKKTPRRRARQPVAVRAMPTPDPATRVPAANRVVALLRGINVGGNNLIKMSVLRESFEALGFSDVVTYIQSGNVVFSSKPAPTRALTRKIETALRGHLGEAAWVLVVPHTDLSAIVEQAPKGFGTEPGTYRYDVLFTREPLTPGEVLAQIRLRDGVDEAHAGTHAVYFRRLISRASQSRLPQLVQTPVYKGVTIRNWNTTTRLLARL